MSEERKLSGADMDAIIARFKQSKAKEETSGAGTKLSSAQADFNDPRYTSFAAMPAYKQLQVQLHVAARTGIQVPYFVCFDGISKDVSAAEGRQLLNFSTYDYVGLNGDARVNAAAAAAAQRYGTSAGASRLVAGEKQVHRDLERSLAEHYGTEDCAALVGGYLTNVTTISSLFGPQDVIFADKLCHNSIMTGSHDSGAVRVIYPHNDPKALEELLRQHRARHQRALIVTEGVFSMDGNIACLPELIKLKQRYGCFLMVDEAHALGVIGAHGQGSAEHFGLRPQDVDIWMGTLSKTLCTCGGFIAGCRELIELIKYKAGGFVYSVGLSPVLAAASLEALQLLHQESWRTAKLQENAQFALKRARELHLDTGLAEGTAILPIIVGSSMKAAFLSNLLYEAGVSVLPIIYPVVSEGAARLRFFFSASHSTEQIDKALTLTAKLLPEAAAREARFAAGVRSAADEALSDGTSALKGSEEPSS